MWKKQPNSDRMTYLDGKLDAPTGGKFAPHSHFFRRTHFYEVIEDPVHDRLIESPAVPKSPQIAPQGILLEAFLGRIVMNEYPGDPVLIPASATYFVPPESKFRPSSSFSRSSSVEQ